jgi:hypothetical protein
MTAFVNSGGPTAFTFLHNISDAACNGAASGGGFARVRAVVVPVWPSEAPMGS